MNSHRQRETEEGRRKKKTGGNHQGRGRRRDAGNASSGAAKPSETKRKTRQDFRVKQETHDVTSAS